MASPLSWGPLTSASSTRRSSSMCLPTGPTLRSISLTSEQAEFIGRVGAKCPMGNPAPYFCFQGVQATTSISGPDGDVIVDHKEIWAGDGDSRIKVIDIATSQFVTTIDTGGKARVDEMAYDLRDHLLAAANNADTPPFVTVFDTKAKTIVAQLIVRQAPITRRPRSERDRTTAMVAEYRPVLRLGSAGRERHLRIGGVSIIDPKTKKVTDTFLVANCSPAGLALGPRTKRCLVATQHSRFQRHPRTRLKQTTVPHHRPHQQQLQRRWCCRRRRSDRRL